MTEWEFWIRVNIQNLMEEANGFFQDWGFEWLSWYQLFVLTCMGLIGPFLMIIQTYRTWNWFKKQRSCSPDINTKDIAEDPDFEKDESMVESQADET